MATPSRFRAYAAIALFLALVPAAPAQYSGGSGTANDPYQIATAADLIALGETPNDYDKHFILTADIDLDPNLPGRKVFDKAVIAPDMNDVAEGFQGTLFTGAFDGGGHMISHLTITGNDWVGLFGFLTVRSEIKDLGVVDVKIAGLGKFVGGLAGSQYYGNTTRCCSTGTVSGCSGVGGLTGNNSGRVTDCYSEAVVSGAAEVGGLVGINGGNLTQCYSVGLVRAGGSTIGGLVGSCWSMSHGHVTRGVVTDCVWDLQVSGQGTSDGGVALTTAEMTDPYILSLNGFGNDPNWVLDAGRDYPHLAWEGTPGDIIPEPDIDWLTGQGTADSPYLVGTPDQLTLLGKASILWDKHFVLSANIDLDPNLGTVPVFSQAVIPVFAGVFDGKGHAISHLRIAGGSNVGLFGLLASGAEVRDLAVVDINVAGSGDYVGGLAGWDHFGSMVTRCYTTGVVSGGSNVGGLVGSNGSSKYWHGGSVLGCHSACVVSGDWEVGGLVGYNDSTVTLCYSAGVVSGTYSRVGGLIGQNNDTVTHCYSSATVNADGSVGGLVGKNGASTGEGGGISGTISNCYSTGRVSGNGQTGGLVGFNYQGWVTSSFWDEQSSGQAESAAGEGKTTTQMVDIQTYLDAGWDFLRERENGLHEIWQMPQEGGCPVLAILSGYTPPTPHGVGTSEDPYIISSASELGSVVYLTPYACYRLAGDVDLSGTHWGTAIVPAFSGTFDGDGHSISQMTITGAGNVGLFGRLEIGAEVRNLGVVDVNINGSGSSVGGLVGNNWGSVTACHSTGTVSGDALVGGLVGNNWGSITACYSNGAVSGTSQRVGGLAGSNYGSITACYNTGSVCGTYFSVGGLAGYNDGSITACYNTGSVCGTYYYVGGLVGEHWGTISACYSTGAVSGSDRVGGLVGINDGPITSSFWDIETSGQDTSYGGGIGKTTAEMQMASTFLDAGWDFVGETGNGTDDIWWINEGKDYPRLWWEGDETSP